MIKEMWKFGFPFTTACAAQNFVGSIELSADCIEVTCTDAPSAAFAKVLVNVCLAVRTICYGITSA